MPTTAVLLLALGSLAPPATARPQPPPARDAWITATYGAGGGDPLGAYLSLGLALGDVRYSGSLVGLEKGHGLLLQADIGRRAGAISVGTPLPFLLKGPRAWEPFGAPFLGIAPKATLVRTWEEGEPRRTYLGPTAELTLLVHVRVGVLWRVAGPSGDERILTWGVGLGF